MKDLSIIITSKNEPYLMQTIEDILSKTTGNTEILWDEDTGLGQRGTMNKLVRASKAKYIMKVDAHCLFQQGFDTKMMDDMDDKTIMSPLMLSLDGEAWRPINQPTSTAYCFDTDLVFQYNREAENSEPVNETMCLQGSAFMVARKTYWEWELCDESLGSWGGQGVELGIKAYLNGGRCVSTKKAYYAHLFREDEKDFPYKRDKIQIRKTAKEVIKRFKNKDIAGLIEKYDYPADWTKAKVKAL